MANTTTVNLSGRYNSIVLSNSLTMEISQFNKWNPGFDKTLAEGKSYSMRIPKDKLAIFESKKGQILMESFRILIEGTTVSK
jgi:membrane-bound lytic murein transglycosylase D